MKYTLISIVLLVAGFLGWWLLSLEPKGNPIAVIQDADEQIASSLPDEGVIARAAAADGESRIRTLWEKHVYPQRLKVADVDFPVVFEGDVPEELKQVILSDVHMIYGHMESHEIYELHNEISVGGGNIVLTKRLGFRGRGRHWPEKHQGAFGGIAMLDSEDTVVFPKQLTDHYELAWRARNDAPAKYEKLEIFIDWLNSASMEELGADNPYWLYGYDGVSDENPELAAEMRARLLGDDRSVLKFRHPSILEFTYVDQEVLKKDKAEGQLPVGVTLADGFYLDQSNVPVQQALYLYHGGKWYIAFAPPGT
ncbi:hypothetical protein [Sulfuriroseicoccus oceanibius]|uniref:Uncharacterized protein n=1 Tax=Sulfuriroseicoccus oceanibius TaxID=2707525 RepID=A0A6B3LFH6_9BACT|nr:hypothetical protein [Sulfuriroseicoccus oceanibius]QQL45769.1 hypothetical protein G3M56_004065 [Sulfuriroseicoccus oceanibius]